MRLVCGLGNPGAAYANTRHNVAWWLLEAARATWSFPAFRREGVAHVSRGTFREHAVALVAPETYVNRSGLALRPFLADPGFMPDRDLLVVVDDVALDVARMRIRGAGSSGGHNGLKSVESELGTSAYARLRIGVGAPPEGVDLADWVLSAPPAEEEAAIDALLPEMVAAVGTWIEEGVEAAARAYNR